MGQVRSLIHFRLRRLRNRTLEGGLGLPLAIFAIGAGVLVAAGYALSPTLYGPTRSGDVIHWGGWTLEAAFYLGCLIAALQSFRILEALFRHREARVLATMPIRLPGLFFYRLGSTFLETCLLSLGCAVFLLPTLIKGGGRYYVAALALLFIAAVVVVTIGYAAQMAAGVADYKHFPGFFSELDRRSGGTGGGAAAYLLSPAIALGVTLALLLLAKLSIEEVLKAWEQNGLIEIRGVARAMAAFLSGVVLLSIASALRNFTRHYPVLFARFFEADIHVVDVGYDYFAADRRPAKGFEARLSGPVRILYRLDRLQLARRTPLTRALVVAAPLVTGALFLGYSDRLEPWMIVGLGLGLLLLLANPWSRLHHPSMDPGQGATLPINQKDRHRARQLLLLRESMLLTIPFALLGLALPSAELMAAALLIPPLGIALVPLLDRLAQRVHQAPRAVGFVIVTLFAGLTSLGLWGPWSGLAAVTALAWLQLQKDKQSGRSS